MLITAVTILILATILGIPAFASADPLEEERVKRVNKLLAEQRILLAERVDQLKEADAALAAEIKRREQAGEIALSNLTDRRKEAELALIQTKAIAAAEEQYAIKQEENLRALEARKAELDAIAAAAIAAGDTLSQDQDDQLQAIIAAAAAARTIAADARKDADDAAILESEANKRRNARLAIQKKTADGLTRLTGLASSFEESMLGAFEKMRIEAGGFTELLRDAGEQFLNQIRPANLLSSAMSKVKESTMAMALVADSAMASFNRTTGAGGQLDDVLLDVRTDAAGMGVSFDTAVAATTDLYLGMRQFSLMTEEAQTEVATFVTGMERLGVATSTSAEFLNNATTAMGMNKDEAMVATRELAASAHALGLAPEEMMSGFNAALPQLAHWGDGAVDVFKGLAAASKATGIEMQGLLGIVGQFDTFEGAAEAAGRLNAVLGDDLLNSMDLMNASEEERIRMMIESIALSGRSWDSMGRFEKRALANAAGITDMAQANQLFGQSLEAYDAQQEAANAGAMSQEEMEERARQNTSAQESLKIMMESMAIAIGPVVKGMNAIMDVILKINGALGGAFVPVLLGVLGIMSLLASATKLQALLESIRYGAFVVHYYWELTMDALRRRALALRIRDMAVKAKDFIFDKVRYGLFMAQYYLELAWEGLKNRQIGLRIKDMAIKAKDFILEKARFAWRSRGVVLSGLENAYLTIKIGLLRIASLGYIQLGAAMLRSLGYLGLIIGAFFIFKKLGASTTQAIMLLGAAFIFLKIATSATGGKIKLLMMALTALATIIMVPMFSPPLYLVLPLLALGIFLLGFAANAASSGLMILGIAALMVGGGMAMMGLGVMMAGVGLSMMFEALSSIPPAQLLQLALALYVLTGALLAIGFAMMLPWASVGLLVLSAGFLAIGAAFRLMSLDKFEAFQRLTDQMKDLDSNVGIKMTLLGWGIYNIADAIDEVPIVRSLILSHTMDKLAETAKITPANVESARKMTEVIREASAVKISFASMLMWDKAVDNLIKVLKGGGEGGGAGGGGGAEGGTTVVLELDGRQLGRTVVELVNRRYNLQTST